MDSDSDNDSDDEIKEHVAAVLARRRRAAAGAKKRQKSGPQEKKRRPLSIFSWTDHLGHLARHGAPHIAALFGLIAVLGLDAGLDAPV